MRNRLLVPGPLIGVLICLLLPLSAIAAPDPEFYLTLEDNLFYPSRLEVPAGVKFRLIITNHDSTPEEFDSFDLNREKVIFPGKPAVIYIGPLQPGEYSFFGEFNPNTARGTVLAVDRVPEARNVD